MQRKSCTPRPGALAPEASAKAARLRYVSDAAPGIRRRRAGSAFRYVMPDGRSLRDDAALKRIRRLAIPPAWTGVWICPQEDGHLQATGYDARGRKQYRYHPRWREVRDQTKYDRLIAFGAALPRIRRRVRRDLARDGLPREKVLATVVKLLERTFIRVGNEAYARENESFGLTTLRVRQVRVRGATMRFKFRGKSGVPHEVQLTDRQLAHVVRRMHELPGEELFQYVDGDGRRHSIESADVNAYLKAIAGEEFTSKDFRTWAGTLLCARELRSLAPPESPAAGRRELGRVVQAVARQLRNTQAVCRKCYIHPGVMESYLEGRLQAVMRGADEAGLLAVLRDRKRRRPPSLQQLLKRSLRLPKAIRPGMPIAARAALERGAAHA